MKKILVLDTSISTENIGDKIIMDYCNNIIKEIFGDSFYVNIPTHDVISSHSYNHSKSSDYRLLCGTNLLTSNMNKRNQWKINMKDSIYLNDVCLFGVGWWQYQHAPNIYTRILYKRVLSKELLHSVRDSYTEKMLKSIGINNVINTACPTMWNLTPEFCKQIPHKKAKDVLVTITDYKKDEINDKKLFDILIKNYNKVYVWIQALDDYSYLSQIVDLKNIIIVNPTLESLDNILVQNNDLDYVGTRLHAGIRALNHQKRTIIIGVDNRATEISKDCNIVVVKRANIETELEKLINSEFTTNIKLPLENIKIWKNQFIKGKYAALDCYRKLLKNSGYICNRKSRK